jgi:hypothetical protein
VAREVNVEDLADYAGYFRQALKRELSYRHDRAKRK